MIPVPAPWATPIQQGQPQYSAIPTNPFHWHYFPTHPPIGPPYQLAAAPNHPALLHNPPPPNHPNQPTPRTNQNEPAQNPLPPPPPIVSTVQKEIAGTPSAAQIEGKVFEVTFVGGRREPYRVIEKRRGKLAGELWLGTQGVSWVVTQLKEAYKSNAEGRFFRHTRIENKALQLFRRSNRGGSFVELTGYQGGSSRGTLCIPEGKTKQGWMLMGDLLHNFMIGKAHRVDRIVHDPPPVRH